MSIVFICGCATIVTGENQPVTIKSDPEGASVYYQDELLGTTPMTKSLHRKQSGYILTIKKDGYKSKDIKLESKINKWFIGNILVWVGFVVDIVTEAAWDIDPRYKNVKLEPAAKAEKTIKVTVQ